MPPEAGLAERPPAHAAPSMRGLGRHVFSFPVFLCAGLVLLNVLTVRARFNDPDLWWHLRMGQTVWTTHAIPHIDLFAFTTNNHAWVPHEWLSELTIYAAYRAGGYAGLMLWLCVFASALSVLLYVLCALYAGNSKIALAGALMGWLFATVGLAIRPLLAGHVLLVVELILLYLGLNRKRAWLWGLPPLFAVWVNCHGSYFAGLLVLAIFVACYRRLPKATLRTLRIAAGLSLPALLLNPSGVGPLLYPLNVLTAQPHALGVTQEWMPLTVTDERGIALFVLAGCLFAAVMLRKATLRLDEALLLAMGFGMALLHTRMLIVFGILAAPVASRLLSPVWPEGRKRDHPAINAALIAVAALIATGSFPARADLENQAARGNPVRAVQFVRQAGLAGPMLNDYTWGGYLIWAMPEHKVFIDGRADVFEWTGVFAEYSRWASLEEDPNRLLDKYGVQFCLLRKSAPASLLLSYLPGWAKAYSDDQAAVFVRRGGSEVASRIQTRRAEK